jgi:adenosylhomocysteinase
MDLGFALQSKCLEAVARGTVTAADAVVPVPRWIDDYVADAYLASRA